MDVVADGRGGAIVTWEDAASQRELDIDAQHVLAGGVDPAWPPEGRPVARAKGDQRSPRISADGAGATIVLWEDCRDGYSRCALQAQHVRATSEIDPAWPSDGLRLAGPRSAPNVVIGDGAGGAIVAGHLRPPGRAGPAGGSCFWARHVLASGMLDPAWPAEGLVLCSPGCYYYNGNLTMVTDAHGGAMVAWAEFPGPDASAVEDSLVVRSQHLPADGRVDPAWPADGRILGICGGGHDKFDIAADGIGAFVIAFVRPGASRRTTAVCATRIAPARKRQ